MKSGIIVGALSKQNFDFADRISAQTRARNRGVRGVALGFGKTEVDRLIGFEIGIKNDIEHAALTLG